jgi:heterodisulfide reductase subunit A2
MNHMTKAALVIGGGVAGLQAALDLAAAGVRVTLLEKQATLGGKMASLLSHDPESLHSSNGIRVPGLREVVEVSAVEALTFAELTRLEGVPGSFRAHIHERSRIVSDACTLCNKCRQVCPVVLPNEFEAGMSFRKAIFSPFTGSVPAGYVVDIDHCLNTPPNYLPCQRCVEVCEVDCIDFTGMPERDLVRDVDAVIVTVGFDTHNPKQTDALGYGRCQDVLDALELESLLSPVGPTGGFLERPSNKEAPDNVLFVLEDPSPFCWAYVAAQCARLREQEITNVTVMYTGTDTQSMVRTEYFGHGPREVKLVPARVKLVHPHEDGALAVRYLPLGNATAVTDQYELVVLGAEIEPSRSIAQLAAVLGLQTTAAGYIQTGRDEVVVATDRPGIYAAGCAIAPKDVSDTLKESKAAVREALKHMGMPIPESIYAHDDTGLAAASPSKAADSLHQFESLVQRLIALGEGSR